MVIQETINLFFDVAGKFGKLILTVIDGDKGDVPLFGWVAIISYSSAGNNRPGDGDGQGFTPVAFGKAEIDSFNSDVVLAGFQPGDVEEEGSVSSRKSSVGKVYQAAVAEIGDELGKVAVRVSYGSIKSQFLANLAASWAGRFGRSLELVGFGRRSYCEVKDF